MRIITSSSPSSPNYLKDIVLLALSWSWTLTTSTQLTTIGPLAAVRLGASRSIASFTIGAYLLGAALSAYPSSLIFRSLGRKGGFAAGCISQIVGAVVGIVSILWHLSRLLFVGCVLIGVGQGLGQFYRFAAVEVAPAPLKSKAIAIVLAGGVIAAFIGPTSAKESVHAFSKDFVGSFLVMAVVAVVNLVTLLPVNFPMGKIGNNNSVGVNEKESPKRSIVVICSRPLFIISCTVATLAHVIMVMLMSNVTLAMIQRGGNLSTASLVMQLHFFAMFAPGFISGSLIHEFGCFWVALLGGLLTLASSLAFLVVRPLGSLPNFVLGMVLLGLGWNFSFSSGTVMLTGCYTPLEAAEVQAVNDAIIFTVAGAGSLVSGHIFVEYGWFALVYVCAALTGLQLILFASAWNMKSEIDNSSTGQTTASGTNNNDEGELIITKDGNPAENVDSTNDNDGDRTEPRPAELPLSQFVLLAPHSIPCFDLESGEGCNDDTAQNASAKSESYLGSLELELRSPVSGGCSPQSVSSGGGSDEHHLPPASSPSPRETTATTPRRHHHHYHHHHHDHRIPPQAFKFF